jgi:hypothetical protein
MGRAYERVRKGEITKQQTKGLWEEWKRGVKVLKEQKARKERNKRRSNLKGSWLIVVRVRSIIINWETTEYRQRWSESQK